MHKHGDMKFFQLFRVELRQRSCVVTEDAPVYPAYSGLTVVVDVNRGKSTENCLGRDLD